MDSYFCNYYDIKEVKREFGYLVGGLSRIAKDLDIQRVGTMHQAGSDSLVTSKVFFRLSSMLSKWKKDSTMDEYNGLIFGLGTSLNDEQYNDEYKQLA